MLRNFDKKIYIYAYLIVLLCMSNLALLYSHICITGSKMRPRAVKVSKYMPPVKRKENTEEMYTIHGGK